MLLRWYSEMSVAKKSDCKACLPQGTQELLTCKQHAYLDILGRVCVKHRCGLLAFKEKRLFLNKHILSVWEDVLNIIHAFLFT